MKVHSKLTRQYLRLRVIIVVELNLPVLLFSCWIAHPFYNYVFDWIILESFLDEWITLGRASIMLLSTASEFLFLNRQVCGFSLVVAHIAAIGLKTSFRYLSDSRAEKLTPKLRLRISWHGQFSCLIHKHLWSDRWLHVQEHSEPK